MERIKKRLIKMFDAKDIACYQEGDLAIFGYNDEAFGDLYGNIDIFELSVSSHHVFHATVKPQKEYTQHELIERLEAFKQLRREVAE